MSLHLEVQRATAADAPPGAQLEAWAARALAGRRDRAELTVRLVDEAEGRHLNARYRGRDYATNVLSFPFAPEPGVDVPLLGDLVICAPVVNREAGEQGRAPAAHWAHMVVHGVLHLLGYDHEEAAQAEEMEALEARILRGLGYGNPYATTTDP